MQLECKEEECYLSSRKKHKKKGEHATKNIIRKQHEREE